MAAREVGSWRAGCQSWGGSALPAVRGIVAARWESISPTGPHAPTVGIADEDVEPGTVACAAPTQARARLSVRPGTLRSRDAFPPCLASELLSASVRGSSRSRRQSVWPVDARSCSLLCRQGAVGSGRRAERHNSEPHQICVTPKSTADSAPATGKNGPSSARNSGPLIASRIPGGRSKT